MRMVGLVGMPLTSPPGTCRKIVTTCPPGFTAVADCGASMTSALADTRTRLPGEAAHLDCMAMPTEGRQESAQASTHPPRWSLGALTTSVKERVRSGSGPTSRAATSLHRGYGATAGELAAASGGGHSPEYTSH